MFGLVPRFSFILLVILFINVRETFTVSWLLVVDHPLGLGRELIV